MVLSTGLLGCASAAREVFAGAEVPRLEVAERLTEVFAGAEVLRLEVAERLRHDGTMTI